MSNCISCNSAPPPCDCSSTQTCVQTPRNCTTCPQNICINLSDSSSHRSSSAGLGGIIGGAIGATTAAILVILSLWILYKRNYLPSCLYHLLSDNNNNNNRSNLKKNHHLQKLHLNPSNSSTTTSNSTSTTATVKHQSIFSRQPHDHNTNSSIPHHQSVIFLPNDDPRAPKSSPLESDDDPFSDIHSGVSFISPRPISKHASLYPTDDRDPFSKAPITSDQSSPTIPSQTRVTMPSPTGFASNSNQRTSLAVPNPIGLPAPPPPTINSSNAYKPIRPHRAPGLDLRLPDAKNPIDSDQPSLNQSNNQRSNDPLSDPSPSPTTPNTIPTTPSYPTNDSLSPYNRTQITLDSSHYGDSEPSSSSFSPHPRRFSGISDTASHDSHLSSILDPAMIVTPVTLVRTASGRQAAVQRVALRGQEKARVVRLPPTANPKPHVPSPLSLETSQASVNSMVNDSENFPETFKFTPSINLALGSRLSWDVDSPNPQTRDGSSVFINSPTVDNKTPTCETAAHANVDQHQQNSNAHKNWSSEEPSKSTNLNRNRSTAAYSTRSSVGSSSVAESFWIDEDEVEFPTVLGRSAAILAHRQSQSNHSSNPTTSSFITALDHPSTVSHHHINMKALGRDRAISLSSIIGEEAARDTFNSSPPPPLPDFPSGTNLITGRNKSSNKLPEPFKPFAGQKPSSSSSSHNNNNINGQTGSSHGSSNNGRVSRSYSSNTVKGAERQPREAEDDDEDEGKRRTRNPEYTKSTFSNASQQSRLSTVSSIRSGYGSVLEGIPFNIGFNSESDDLFNFNHLSSNLNLNFNLSLGDANHTGHSSPIGGPNSVVNSSNSSIGRMSAVGSGHFSLGEEANRSSFPGVPSVVNRIGDHGDDEIEAEGGSHQDKDQSLNNTENPRTNISNQRN